MKNKLQQYFPMIRTEGEVLKELRENKRLWETFCGWEEKYQKEYLDICTGVKGVKLLYDTYFKAIMNPDTRPERLNDFLSEILGKKIKILKVLPNESAKIAAESSLLIMDIVVQFEEWQYCKCRSSEGRILIFRTEKCLLLFGSVAQAV